MPCARCSVCAINYPLGKDRCLVCKERLDPLADTAPHADWEQRVEAYSWERTAEQRAADAADAVVSWRLAELLRLGVRLEDAEELARRQSGPERVDLHRVRLLVAAGCPPATAARIVG